MFCFEIEVIWRAPTGLKTNLYIHLPISYWWHDKPLTCMLFTCLLATGDMTSHLRACCSLTKSAFVEAWFDIGKLMTGMTESIQGIEGDRYCMKLFFLDLWTQCFCFVLLFSCNFYPPQVKICYLHIIMERSLLRWLHDKLWLCLIIDSPL